MLNLENYSQESLSFVTIFTLEYDKFKIILKFETGTSKYLTISFHLFVQNFRHFIIKSSPETLISILNFHMYQIESFMFSFQLILFKIIKLFNIENVKVNYIVNNLKRFMHAEKGNKIIIPSPCHQNPGGMAFCPPRLSTR